MSNLEKWKNFEPILKIMLLPNSPSSPVDPAGSMGSAADCSRRNTNCNNLNNNYSWTLATLTPNGNDSSDVDRGFYWNLWEKFSPCQGKQKIVEFKFRRVGNSQSSRILSLPNRFAHERKEKYLHVDDEK